VTAVCYDVVVPTIGRPDLARLLTALDRADGPRPGRVVIVDDRPSPTTSLALPGLTTLSPRVVRSGGHGPAAARNAGWRRCAAPWIAFLDDDVVPEPDWWLRLTDDLVAVDRDDAVAAVAGRIVVPAPCGRRPTDAERGVLALASATWITADMAIRRTALVETNGFDERFRRAYREDTELALRLTARDRRIALGRRTVVHPVRTGTWRSSIGAQRGNADDMLVRRLHGPDWRRRGHAPRGRLAGHAITTSAAAAAIAAWAVGRRALATVLGAAAAASITQFAAGRVRRGPIIPREIARMVVSSAVIPFAATGWAAVGWWRARASARRGTQDQWSAAPPRLVLFDRDGTLIRDVPYNGDPELVVSVQGARSALARLRDRGIQVGMITNQSGIARGLLTHRQVRDVNARVEQLLGPFSVVEYCPHAPSDGCGCRKPATGMLVAALDRLGVAPHECAVVGDIEADVEAGLSVGARAILVPNERTRPAELRNAPEVALDLDAAVRALLLDRDDAGPSGDVDVRGRSDLSMVVTRPGAPAFVGTAS
jgi:HAD superfamily hydrolase (TIGR01662 family)